MPEEEVIVQTKSEYKQLKKQAVTQSTAEENNKLLKLIADHLGLEY
jgi:hypothetical protein